jgi:Uma2 family endonuclease
MSTASELRLTNADLEAMPEDGTNERMKTVAGGRFQAAPEIVIEIFSPGPSNQRRDRRVKRNLYAARGVDEYWLADPENRTVEMHRRNAAGDLAFDRSFLPADDLTSAFFPGSACGSIPFSSNIHNIP